MSADEDRDCPICGAETEVIGKRSDHPKRDCTDSDCNWSLIISGTTTTKSARSYVQ